MKAMHRFKKVYIPTGEVKEEEFTDKHYPEAEIMGRDTFLEVINSWNAIALLQSKMDSFISKKVDWMYIAL